MASPLFLPKPNFNIHPYFTLTSFPHPYPRSVRTLISSAAVMIRLSISPEPRFILIRILVAKRIRMKLRWGEIKKRGKIGWRWYPSWDEVKVRVKYGWGWNEFMGEQVHPISKWPYWTWFLGTIKYTWNPCDDTIGVVNIFHMTSGTPLSD